ncbi:MAG: glutamate racemase [Arcobacter sp.]|nr:MAG: glutamate racemase [Arcobacter sp.]
MKVGVFDSGVGGLTVVKSLLEHKLFEEIIYFGDTARVPYGIKDKNTVTRYSLEALEFFKNFEIDLLITACNTVSAYSLNELKEAAPFDVVGVVEPGILALENTVEDKNANILIIGTKATIKSRAYEKPLISNQYSNISACATGLFVPIVEEGLYEGEVLESAMHHYFKDLEHPDAIILGCTHFPLIEKAISNYFQGNTQLIHSGEAIVEYLEHHYDFSKKFEKTELKLFASENPEALRAVAKKWLDL